MLKNIRIASPCSADWNQMVGDDRVRHCQACNLNVYNFAAFTEQEIHTLLANREGRLCGRLFQRKDGTVLTQNCPVGVRAVVRRISRIAGALFSFLAPGFLTTPVLAQTYTLTNMSDAAISVDIVDQTGAPIPHASATIRELKGKNERNAQADDHGRLLLRVPKSGKYVLTVTVRGFATFTRTYNLRSGEMLSAPAAVLNVGTVGK